MFSTVHLNLPNWDLFQLPPSNDPLTLLPPAPGSSRAAPPFAIPSDIFLAALDIKVPITIALTYAVTAISLNKYNASRGNKPWSISKTGPFKVFVILHNVFLAVYSAWTFYGMCVALSHTLNSPFSSGGLAATVDSLCKVQGAHGLGNAVAYDPSASQWVSQAPTSVLLTSSGEPNPADLGRLWSEGLAFYGWFFYLSKFYEVLDTFIILAKGKKSSTLQTYHHAGAMMCMWAGIRYMSPPIWLFVFLNSFIHTLMYTYYTLTAFRVPISQSIKRSLTTMQIIQFLVGTAYAAMGSFISYTIPVQVPYFEDIISGAPKVESTTTLSSAIGLASQIKKVLLRAAGEEGVAENVNIVKTAAESLVNRITSYKTEYKTVPCIDTSGQTFGIWLNVLYLTPLTVLFVRFFIRSYHRRTSTPPKKKLAAIEEAGKDAAHGIERRIDSNGFADANGNGVVLNGQANGHVNKHANGNTKHKFVVS